MKRIISILVTVVMLVSVATVFGISVNAAEEPVVTKVENYTVTIDGITDIKEIRFAIGHYTTGSQVKAAEKNVTLDAATVNKNTLDGIFTYDLPWVGEYTFWVRFNDGSQYFIYTSVEDIKPYVTSNGVMLTVNDFGENYKDAWIAEGTFNTYNEIKASTAFKYQASANKLANYAKTNHDFTYTLTNPGDYTVLIRYNDGKFDVVHHTLTVTYPEFNENGLQVTVTNIPGIKIIRTAYGHYTSVADIKKVAQVRNFNNKTAIKDAESYTVQYREEGEITMVVEFTNGYKHFYYYNVAKKVPTVEEINGGVKFGSLDGLVMIRYAKGEYTSSSEIKAAEGSVVVKPDAISDGFITVSGLTVGQTYTFSVQYNDDSYNYYVITVTDNLPEEPVITAPTFVVDSVKAAAGNSVNVKIAVANNPGIASIGMHVAFDESLTLNSVTYNSDIGGMPYQPEEFETPVKLVWVSPYADVAGDFTFVTLNFTVAEGTEAGEYPVYVSYDADDVYDMSESNIAFDVVNGVITVVE
ncbi:MAG: hypothetical protein IJA55_10365 [Clostridia bacterium]|nr:hypothetical protein [Clostridia bacterium]